VQSLVWLIVLLAIGTAGPVGPTVLRESTAAEPMQQRLNQPARGCQKQWIRGGWIPDMPSHLTPDRVHGGLSP
jgi:hypothetical protein